MTTDHWLRSALTNDVLVAELLLRAKHSPSAATTSTAITTLLPPRWGHRKNRSKSAGLTTAAANRGKDSRGSPTTHLSWSGGGGGWSSDGFDESSRPSDLSSGSRSVKVNEGASTSGYHKSEKRKIFQNEQELTSMRVILNQPYCENLKKIKINLNQNPKNKTRAIAEHDRHMKLPSLVTQSCRVEAETVAPKKGFVLPDLNIIPNEEDVR